jgi:guanylate kinase
MSENEMNLNNKHLIVISSPSGGGKSTVANYILKNYPYITFSISATTRKKRDGEQNGIHYFFLNREEFFEKVNEGNFIEYEELFGNYYGTLRSEVEKALKNDNFLLFDVDVKGAFSIKKSFPDDSVLLFIAPTNIDQLEQRLISRQSESQEQIQKRLERVQMELDASKYFDIIIINDKLEETLDKVDKFFRQILPIAENNK